MSKSFEFQLKQSPDALIAQAKEAARNNGIHFEGDGQTGHFAGHGIEGSYLVLENTLSVQVAKKPFIMPWSLIEAKLRDFFV